MYTRRSLLPFTFAAASLAAGLLASSPAAADIPPDPPTARIVSPEDGASFEGPTASVDIVTQTTLDEQLASVILRVDGEDVATADTAPWDFPGVELSEGMHTLMTVAVANDMEQTPSFEVNVVVFGAGETSGGEDSSGGSCAVDSDARLGAGSALFLLAVFGLGLARRRRGA